MAVLERLQAMKLSKQPGVIALTALGRDDFISRAVNLGVNYYMVKPFDFMMLAQRVYEAAGESLRAEALSAKMIHEAGRQAQRRNAGRADRESLPDGRHSRAH